MVAFDNTDIFHARSLFEILRSGLMRGLAQEVDEDRHGQDAPSRSQGADDHADPHSDDESEDGAHGRSPVVRAGVCAGPAGSRRAAGPRRGAWPPDARGRRFCIEVYKNFNNDKKLTPLLKIKF